MRYLYILITILSLNAYAVVDNAVLLKANKSGVLLFTTCIVTPPIEPTQITHCNALYTQYITLLSTVAAPTPISINSIPSSTTWSPYDVCRFDAAVFVFNNPLTKPYCPSL